ncbi:hypothetical protein LINPERPRIM_LOCUS9584, partial [Linum perenne]
NFIAGNASANSALKQGFSSQQAKPIDLPENGALEVAIGFMEVLGKDSFSADDW